MSILETKRLILRQLNHDDVDMVYDLVYADPEVKKAWSGREGTPEEIKKGFAEEHINPESLFGLKGVALKNTGDLIGLMGFQTHDPGEGKAIGYLLSVEEPYRRVGYDPDYIEAELTYALGKRNCMIIQQTGGEDG